jgi:Prokaryotic homologs of the JAB domain
VVTIPVREGCILVGRNGTVLWRDNSGTPAALPDSRARWEAIWRHRAELAEIAHSHPRGPLAFSAEDLTTMAAIDAALGRPLCYSVVTGEKVLRRTAEGATLVLDPEPAWASALRLMSGLTERN